MVDRFVTIRRRADWSPTDPAMTSSGGPVGRPPLCTAPLLPGTSAEDPPGPPGTSCTQGHVSLHRGMSGTHGGSLVRPTAADLPQPPSRPSCASACARVGRASIPGHPGQAQRPDDDGSSDVGYKRLFRLRTRPRRAQHSPHHVRQARGVLLPPTPEASVVVASSRPSSHSSRRTRQSDRDAGGTPALLSALATSTDLNLAQIWPLRERRISRSDAALAEVENDQPVWSGGIPGCSPSPDLRRGRQTDGSSSCR